MAHPHQESARGAARSVALVAAAGLAMIAALALMLILTGSAQAHARSHHHNGSGGTSGGAGLGVAGTPAGGKGADNPEGGPTGPYTGDSNHLGDRILRPGMSGHDVRVLQEYLTIVGYPTPIVGHYGPLTRHNVIAFKISVGLPATGVVDRTAEEALRAAVIRVDSLPPVGRARINGDGTATVPANAPPVVKAVVRAANQILHTSYCYAGGHGSWKSSCYDCSGSVSYALHGAGLLSYPEDSTGLESWGSPGKGRWITVYANAGHTFLVVAGIAFDTADFGGPNIPAGTGPRWRSNPLGNLADGGNYVIRHPAGL